MAHRRAQKDQRKALSREPTRCRRCGSTEILYGKKRGLCKKCRGNIRKPYGGWVDAEGNKKVITILQCGQCEKIFAQKRNADPTAPDVCPKCGADDVEVVETW